MIKLSVGNVIEFDKGGLYIITRQDENFIYAKEVNFNCEINSNEIILFTVRNLEKEMCNRVKDIINMSEVARRYLALA